MPRPSYSTDKSFMTLDGMDERDQLADLWSAVDRIRREQHLDMFEACRRVALWVRKKGRAYRGKSAPGRYDEKLGMFVGFAPDGKERCPVPGCEDGHVKVDVPWADGLLPYSYVDCGVCGGTGWVDKGTSEGDGNG